MPMLRQLQESNLLPVVDFEKIASEMQGTKLQLNYFLINTKRCRKYLSNFC